MNRDAKHPELPEVLLLHTKNTALQCALGIYSNNSYYNEESEDAFFDDDLSMARIAERAAKEKAKKTEKAKKAEMAEKGETMEKAEKGETMEKAEKSETAEKEDDTDAGKNSI